MNNFARALRLTLAHRWTFVASILCAIGVAVLWGGSISSIYPFIAVALEGKSLQEWADKSIERSQASIAELHDKAAAIERELAASADDKKLLHERYDVERHLTAEQRWLAGSTWLRDRVIVPYLPRDAFQTVVIIAMLLLASTLVKCMLLIINAILVSRMVQLAIFDLTKKFYRHTLRMDLAHFSAEGSSDLMSRFTYDTECLANGLRELFGKFIREPLKMIACLAGAAWISWQLLLLSMLLAPLAGLSIGALSKALKRANRRAMEEMSQIYSTLDETLQGIKVVKAFTMERHERRRFHKNSKKYYQKSMRIARYDSLTRPLVEMLGISTILVALLAGAYLGIKQENYLFGIRMSERPLSIEGLMMFFGLLAGASDPARKLSEVFSRIQRASAAADRIYQVIDREPQVVDPPRPAPAAAPPRPGVRRRQVSLPAQPAGAARNQPADCLRRNDRHRRPQRLRQDDAGEPDSAVLRPHFRERADRRRRPARRAAGGHSFADRPGDAGNAALRRHGLEQHPLRLAACDPRRSDRGRQPGPRP